MSFFFVTAGLAIFLLMVFIILTDMLDQKRLCGLLIDNGQNPMIAYVGQENLVHGAGAGWGQPASNCDGFHPLAGVRRGFDNDASRGAECELLHEAGSILEDVSPCSSRVPAPQQGAPLPGASGPGPPALQQPR